MTTFTIDNETNNIIAHTSIPEAVAGAEQFSTAAQFDELAAKWPANRLVEIWNSLPGVRPVKKFEKRKKAAGRIWSAIVLLGQPQAASTADVADAKANVGPAKGKSAHNKATKGKRALKGHAGRTTSRDGSKKAEVLALLQRPKGVTLSELMKSTDWQAHSVRGFLSGALGKKMGLKVESSKCEDGERVYKLLK
jgi:hypothetical protein